MLSLGLFWTAVVIIACVLLNKLSGKIGMPMLLAFIGLGMFFGSDGVVKIPFDDFALAEKICSGALVFIMFYGGFGTKLQEAKPVMAKALLLSSLGVVMTAALVGVFCHFALKIGIWESFLIGAVLGSTDAASVFSVLRSKRLNLKYRTASMLEVESGSNDPFAYMMAATILSIMGGRTGNILIELLKQIAFGAAAGGVIAFAAVWFLRHFSFDTSGFDTAFILAVALLAYAVPAMIGGNGYLSAYIVGIILGNAPIQNKKTLVHFFDGATGLMQMLIFFLLGLLAFPSKLPAVVLPAMAVALFITFVARPIAVAAILTPFKAKINQQTVIAWAGLRGAASVVFAVMAVVSGVSMENDLFHMVFCVVLFSIAVQGSLLAVVARKTDMIDSKGSVFKTFTDYTEEAGVQFLELSVQEGHAWIGKTVREITTPPGTLLNVIFRSEERIIPNGETVIQAEDRIVLSAPAYEDYRNKKFYEYFIDEKDERIGKSVMELDIPEDTLVMMIKRGEDTVIPNGDTIINEGDILVVTAKENARKKRLSLDEIRAKIFFR